MWSGYGKRENCQMHPIRSNQYGHRSIFDTLLLRLGYSPASSHFEKYESFMESKRYLGKMALNFFLFVLVAPGYAQQAPPAQAASQVSNHAQKAEVTPPAHPAKPN